jgi:hypothetical protein
MDVVDTTEGVISWLLDEPPDVDLLRPGRFDHKSSIDRTELKFQGTHKESPIATNVS